MSSTGRQQGDPVLAGRDVGGRELPVGDVREDPLPVHPDVGGRHRRRVRDEHPRLPWTDGSPRGAVDVDDRVSRSDAGRCSTTSELTPLRTFTDVRISRRARAAEEPDLVRPRGQLVGPDDRAHPDPAAHPLAVDGDADRDARRGLDDVQLAGGWCRGRGQADDATRLSAPTPRPTRVDDDVTEPPRLLEGANIITGTVAKPPNTVGKVWGRTSACRFAPPMRGTSRAPPLSTTKEIIMGKISLLAGGAVGYVLGARAGRERFEQIKSQAQTVWEHPKVQEHASKVQGVAKRKASEAQDKVSELEQLTDHEQLTDLLPHLPLRVGEQHRHCGRAGLPRLAAHLTQRPGALPVHVHPVHLVDLLDQRARLTDRLLLDCSRGCPPRTTLRGSAGPSPSPDVQLP